MSGKLRQLFNDENWIFAHELNKTPTSENMHGIAQAALDPNAPVAAHGSQMTTFTGISMMNGTFFKDTHTIQTLTAIPNINEQLLQQAGSIPQQQPTVVPEDVPITSTTTPPPPPPPTPPPAGTAAPMEIDEENKEEEEEKEREDEAQPMQVDESAEPEEEAQER